MEFFTGLEADRLAWGDTDFGAGAGIATDPGLPGADVEDAEAAQFDPLPVGERFFERLEDRVHSRLGLVALQSRALNHLVNNVLFYQDFPPSGELPDSVVIVESFGGIVNVARLP